MKDELMTIIAENNNVVEISDKLMYNESLLKEIAEYSQSPGNSEKCGLSANTKPYYEKKGDTIYLLGDYKGGESDNSSHVEIINDAIEKGLVKSASAINGKGLFLSLIANCSVNDLGFDITSDSEIDEKRFLFNPDISSFLITVDGENEEKFVDYIYNNGMEITLLGHVTRGELRMDELSFGYISDFKE